MAKEVGVKIKITSQGGEKVISNIKDLETELGVLNKQLKTQDFGSEAFKETTRNIKTLKSAIQDVNQETQGIGVDKRLQDIATTASSLVGSFQALSGAIGLFSADERTLKEVQEAEAKALNVLNVALGINNVLTDLNISKKLKDTITTKIQTLTTKAAAAAQRLWNLALKANPIGLVITAVAALTTAIFLFTRQTEKSVVGLDKLKIETDELNKVSEKALLIRDAELKKIIPLITLTEKENISKSNRNKAIRLIQKEYPDYLKNQDLEKTTIEDIEKANNDLVKSIEKVARSKAALNELTTIYQEELKVEDEIQKTITKGQQDLQKVIKTGDRQIIQGQKDYNALLLINAERNAKKTREELKIRKNVVLGFIDETSAIKDLTGSVNTNTKAQKQNTDVVLSGLQKRIELITKTITKLQEAQSGELTYTAQILEAQKEVLDAQENFLKDRTELFKTEGEKILDNINEYLFKTIPSLEEVKKLADGYADLFDVIDKAVSSGQIDFKTATGWEDFVKFAETKLPGIGEKLVNVNEESRASFVEYFNSLDDRLNEIIKLTSDNPLVNLFGDKVGVDDLNKLRKVEEQISNIQLNRVKTGKTELDVRKESLKVIESTFGITDKLKTLQQEILDNTFNIESVETSQETKEILKARNVELNNTIKAYQDLSKTILDGVIKNDKFIQGLRQIGIEADANEKKINKLKNEIDKPLSPEVFEGIKEFFKGQAASFDIILTDVFNNSQQYFNKLGKEGMAALFLGLKEGLPEVEQQTRKDLEKLISFLTIAGDELANTFNLPENPFIKYIDDAILALKKLPKETDGILDDLTDIVNKVVEVFSNISGRISNIVASNNALLFQQLEQAEEGALQIIGDKTEKQREEQLKAQREYAKKRFELEKKSRIQELQFTLANSIASGAQAYIQALGLAAPPPIPQLYALSIAGLTGVEVLSIRDQIRTTQGSVFIGRRGGLIQGGSHEEGGVPAMLEGGEFVMSRPAVDRFGDIVGQMNQSVGGRGLALDDSRIVQAISSQNTSKTPIKTFVLFQDIKDTDKLNKRIEKLSRL
jgi:hypothetical protein